MPDFLSDKAIDILTKTGISLLILAAGYVVMRILLRIAKKALDRSQLDEALHVFILNTAKVILWVVLIITVLGTLGIPTSTFIAILGAAGAAVALALKDSLGNFSGGILILMTKPYSKGDYIEDLETGGKVEKIDLLYTTLKTYDNRVIIVPNGKLANATVINYTKEPTRRVDCKFGISYNDDMQKAMEILRIVAESDPRIFREPEPVIGVAGQEDSCVSLDLRVWCNTEDYWDIKYYLEEQVKLAFDEAGVTIPFPQMDVHVRK